VLNRKRGNGNSQDIVRNGGNSLPPVIAHEEQRESA